ncbi:MAG: ABC transporter substrate-binding protein [Deltaproteobacteria bacterium]|nr:ABC transporter substrate-binding protein [Deltaproteobacteria bacterium]
MRRTPPSRAVRARPASAAAALALALTTTLVLATAACRRASPGEVGARTRIVLRHQPLWGDPAPFRALLAEFGRAHPELDVVTELLPNDSDLLRQLYVTALDGGDASFDVLVLDVIWVAEFARAGWIADLSDDLPPAELRATLLPGPAAVAVQDGHTWAVPWYIDVGLLYYRTDLMAAPPRTYAALASTIREVQRAHPGMLGYLWQGRQYEGLSCNAFESIWGHGGEVLAPDGRLVLDSPEARAGLAWLRTLVAEGLSPSSVLSAGEEDARRLFQSGRAVFMRNWPYASGLLEQPGSPVRGRVGMTTLPSLDGVRPGAGTLGGWFLAVNAQVSPARRHAAARLIAHLTSPEAALLMATAYARNPARRALYADPRLRAQAPFIADLLPLVEAARPRPPTPYYNLLADTLQGELSGAVIGLRSPGRALSRSQQQIDHLLAGSP